MNQNPNQLNKEEKQPTKKLKMSKKGSCELCTKPSRMFCESDQASLCWDCDEKVHSANFLVAKHSRTLLCHVCFSHTPWKADGLKLGPTVSVCHACSLTGQQVSQESESDDGEYDTNSDTDTETEEEEDEEEDDGENQVVPWTETETETAIVSSTVRSVSSSDEDEEKEVSLKRMREDPFEYEDEDGCCSSQNSDSKLCEAASERITRFQCDENSGTSSLSSRLLRPLKMRRTSNNNSAGSLDLTERSHQMNGTAAIVDKLRKLQQEIVTGEGEVILGICKLATDA